MCCAEAGDDDSHAAGSQHVRCITKTQIKVLFHLQSQAGSHLPIHPYSDKNSTAIFPSKACSFRPEIALAVIASFHCSPMMEMDSWENGWQTGTGVSTPWECFSLLVKKDVRSNGIHLIKRKHPQRRTCHLDRLAHRGKQALLEHPNKDKIGQMTHYNRACFSPLSLTRAPGMTNLDGSRCTEDR